MTVNTIYSEVADAEILPLTLEQDAPWIAELYGVKKISEGDIAYCNEAVAAGGTNAHSALGLLTEDDSRRNRALQRQGLPPVAVVVALMREARSRGWSAVEVADNTVLIKRAEEALLALEELNGDQGEIADQTGSATEITPESLVLSLTRNRFAEQIEEERLKRSPDKYRRIDALETKPSESARQKAKKQFLDNPVNAAQVQSYVDAGLDPELFVMGAKSPTLPDIKDVTRVVETIGRECEYIDHEAVIMVAKSYFQKSQTLSTTMQKANNLALICEELGVSFNRFVLSYGNGAFTAATETLKKKIGSITSALEEIGFTQNQISSLIEDGHIYFAQSDDRLKAGIGLLQSLRPIDIATTTAANVHKLLSRYVMPAEILYCFVEKGPKEISKINAAQFFAPLRHADKYLGFRQDDYCEIIEANRDKLANSPDAQPWLEIHDNLMEKRAKRQKT